MNGGSEEFLDVLRFTSALFVLTLIPAPGIAPPLVGQEAGVIEGTLSLRLGPQRRWASRYPGAGPTSAKVHPVPAVRNLSTTMGHSTGLIREQCPVW